MPVLYQHSALLTCADAAGLSELLASGLERFVVRRLGERTVMVDHQRLDDLRKLLKRLGQTPRVTLE